MSAGDGAGPAHRNVNPPGLLAPVGFSHATVAAPGRTIYLGGQTGERPDGTIDEDLVAQFDQALGSLVRVLDACGAAPTDLVSVTILTTDMPGYRASSRELGRVWRRHLGAHYPAMALVGVAALHHPGARVEVLSTAVVPDAAGGAPGPAGAGG